MDQAAVRLSQVYELQRTALINVHYYAARVSKITKVNRIFQIVAALSASATVAAVLQGMPQDYKWIGVTVSLLAAITASVVAVFNFSDSLARLERMHSTYKMIYYSLEALAKQTIGADGLTGEQESTLRVLEAQMAVLGPQDEIDPDERIMKAAQERVERQLPDSYYYPQSA